MRPLLTKELIEEIGLKPSKRTPRGNCKNMWVLDEDTLLVELAHPFSEKHRFEVRFMDSKEHRYQMVDTIDDVRNIVRALQIEELPLLQGRHTCHDCGVMEGQIHQLGCDMERCPWCGHQLISCMCRYKQLGLVNLEKYPSTQGLPPDIYSGGLSDELEDKFKELLNKKGRTPFLVFPNMCGRCGKLWPEMFNVSDEEWEKVVPIQERHQMFCRDCYNFIKKIQEGITKKANKLAKKQRGISDLERSKGRSEIGGCPRQINGPKTKGWEF